MSEYLKAYIRTVEAFGWEGGPEFSTNIVQLRSGRERANAAWAQPRFFFSLPYQNIRARDQYAAIYEMFMVRRGRWGKFLYQSPIDPLNSADEAIFAVAEAGQTEFKLGKWSIVDGVSFYHEVDALCAPGVNGAAVNIDPVITANGSPITPVTIDHDRAVITTAPMAGGEVLAWSGQFSFWVRFDNDRLPFSIDNRSGDDYVVNGSADLIQTPPPEIQSP